MNEKERVAFRALLDRLAPQAPESLLRHLSSQDEEAISLVSSPEGGIKAFLATLEERIAGIHYSWLSDWIRGQPTNLWLHFLAALPEMWQGRAARLLDSNEPLPSLPPITRKLLLEQLYLGLAGEKVIPAELLQDPLLNLSKQELVFVIGLLGLMDVAAGMRRLLEREKKEAIRSLLSKESNRFLDRALKSQDPYPYQELRLDRWSGDEKQLANLCQRLGLQRLGGALSSASSSLLWHLSHRLDTQRGHQLTKRAADEIDPGVQRALAAQTSDAIHLLQRHTP